MLEWDNVGWLNQCHNDLKMIAGQCTLVKPAQLEHVDVLEWDNVGWLNQCANPSGLADNVRLIKSVPPKHVNVLWVDNLRLIKSVRQPEWVGGQCEVTQSWARTRS